MKQKHNVSVEGLGIEISTGTLAGLASGAVTISKGETDLLVTVTAAASLRPGQDFFPLTVDYREKFSAGGKFPGGYFKREGKPSEKEILTSRLCDRPLRPLFPKGFMNEVQVIGLLLATDTINEPDVLMINGASAATLISDIPWNGPVGAVRIGQVDGEFVVNPTHDVMLDSDLDLIYVGSETEMLMIEGSAEFVTDERFYEALEFAQDAIQPIIKAQRELAELCGKAKKAFDLVETPPEVVEFCERYAAEKVREALTSDSYSERKVAIQAITDETAAALKQELGEDTVDDNDVARAFDEIQEKLYRKNILETGRRVDGRGVEDLRAISCDTGVLPRVHGSGKPRLWSSVHSEQAATSRISTDSPVVPKVNPSSSTTTSRRSPPENAAVSALPAGGSRDTEPLPSARSCQSCPRRTSSPTPSGWSPRS